MKKLLRNLGIALLINLFGFVTVFAQSSGFWYPNGGGLLPVVNTWTLGIPTVEIPNGYFTNLSVSGILTIGGIADSSVVIDVTDPEALLVRKDGDTGDIFIVDTTNELIKADTIGEITTDNGVLIDGIKLKDGVATVFTGGTNTFNITNGTAILDIATGSTLNVDGNLTVESASAINQDLTTDASVAFTGLSNTDSNITNVGDIAIDSISPDGTNISITVGAGTLGIGDGTYTWSHTPQVGIEGVLEVDGAIYADSNIQIANNTWLRSTDVAGTGTVDMIKVNASDNLEFGGSLVLGTFDIDEDSGAIDLFDMAVTSAADDVEQSYGLKIDGQDIARPYALSAGGSAIDNKEFRLGNDTDLLIRAGTGGLNIRTSQANANITASASITINVNVPTNSKLMGTQCRVDQALAGGETWDAAYATGATQVIASAQAVTQNTKVNKFFDDDGDVNVTTDETDIVITKNGGGSFTAQGNINCITYYQDFTAMSSL